MNLFIFFLILGKFVELLAILGAILWRHVVLKNKRLSTQYIWMYMQACHGLVKTLFHDSGYFILFYINIYDTVLQCLLKFLRFYDFDFGPLQVKMYMNVQSQQNPVNTVHKHVLPPLAIIWLQPHNCDFIRGWTYHND